jgi:hypothetical protein
VLVDKILHEAWTNKKYSLKHVICFGCDVYLHVPRENRCKLDNKEGKCIFICYKDGIKCYKLWGVVTKKIVYSRDAVFREVKIVPK